jgi:serine O-acetyltransferase
MNREELLNRLLACDRLPLRTLVAQDVRRYGGLRQALLYPGFLLVLLHRLAHLLHRRRIDLPARFLQLVGQIVFRCDISRKAVIGPGLSVYHPISIFVGERVVLGARVTLGMSAFIGARERTYDPDDYPVVDDDVSIGPGAKVLGGITVGAASTIGPNAVVLKSIDSGTVVLPPESRAYRKEAFDTRDEPTKQTGVLSNRDFAADLQRFVTVELLHRKAGQNVGTEESLTGSGALDSVGMMEVVAFIDRQFGISVDDRDITPENFDTIARMQQYLTAKMANQSK